ncbi:MAG: EAL domain-containing protein [Spongiibacteraceae bacterium]
MMPMRMSYLAKLILVAITLIATVQFVTYIAARRALLDATVQSAHSALRVGADVFAQSMTAQADQLKGSVSVLVNDFGFREALATRDAGTIDSALRNQADRVAADRALAIGNDFMLLADTNAKAGALPPQFFELLKAADRDGSIATNIVLDDVPYILVVTPVRSPTRIGWVGMGFALDNTLAEKIKQLTRLDVAFFSDQQGSQQKDSEQGGGGSHYIAGTFSAVETTALAATFGEHLSGQPHEITLNDQRVMQIDVPLTRRGVPLYAVLQLPMETVLEPYYRLSQQMWWLVMAGLLFAIAAAVLVGRRLTQTVRELAGAAVRVSSGDYSARVAVRTRDELGELAHAFNRMQDAVVEREQRIVHQGEHDALTGLANRSVARRELIAAINAAEALGKDPLDKNTHVAVLAIDLNHFKSINDAFGHGIGDRVLCHVAERMQTAVKHSDTVVRLGNDEFLLVLAGVDSALALGIAQRLLGDLAKALHLGELHFSIDAHVGIAVFPDDGASAEVLMRRADIAMARCKQDSANPLATRVARYQNGWEEARMRRLSLVHELRDAIANGGLHLRFQPKLKLSAPEYIGGEALVRWVHPTLGFIGPDEFIPLAESSGHIVELTRWVLNAGIQQIAAWAQLGLAIKLSVNISALDLLNDDLPAYIARTLHLHGVSAQSLCLELTESSVMHEVQRSLMSMQRLRDLGLRLSIDDFGTGQSSLALLKKLPIDELKIDKSFVLKLDQSEDDRVIVHSTIELGHNMGLEVVAEGVETEASRVILRELGCDMVQGFLLAKPLPAAEFTQWVIDHRQRVMEEN